jgi:hypothetical protein
VAQHKTMTQERLVHAGLVDCCNRCQVRHDKGNWCPLMHPWVSMSRAPVPVHCCKCCLVV